MARTRMTFLRPFTTRIFNPISRLVAGRLPLFGILSYVGRRAASNTGRLSMSSSAVTGTSSR
jgi:hypothetical protein